MCYDGEIHYIHYKPNSRSWCFSTLKSHYYKSQYHGKELINSDCFSDTLLRLPFYYELSEADQNKVIDSIKGFYKFC